MIISVMQFQIIGVGSTEDRYNSGFNGIHTITSVTPTSVSYNSGYTASVGVHSVYNSWYPHWILHVGW